MNQRERGKADEIANYARSAQSKLERIIQRAEAGELKDYHLSWLHLVVLMDARLENGVPVDPEIEEQKRIDKARRKAARKARRQET